MNRLAGHDVAIVTPVAGTTRDLLRERIEIDGVPVELIDTAGLRDETDQRCHRSRRHATRARGHRPRGSCAVRGRCGSRSAQPQSFEAERSALPEGVPVTVVMNKMRSAGRAGREPPQSASGTPPAHRHFRHHRRRVFPICARCWWARPGRVTPAPARSLRAPVMWMRCDEARSTWIWRTAHLQSKQGELAAFELRNAQKELGEVVGDVSSDELLGHIFGSFCIGK